MFDYVGINELCTKLPNNRRVDGSTRLECVLLFDQTDLIEFQLKQSSWTHIF